MKTKKIHSILAASLLSTPIVSQPFIPLETIQTPTASQRASIRRMNHILGASARSHSADEIAKFAQQNCVNEGVLKKQRDYIYLKLNKEYLELVFNKIKETSPNVRRPSFHGKIGPHISIIRHDEWKGTPPDTISEISSRYLFTPTRVDVIETAHKRLWVLVVEPSSDLAAVREKYAIGSKPHGHEFHITLAQESF